MSNSRSAPLRPLDDLGSVASTSPGSRRERPPRTAHSRWSWRIGTLAGIPVQVHATFAFLLAWVALSHVMQGHAPAQIAIGLLLVMSIFVCVVFHELSHALVARRFGIQTREITLLPIGGMARLERMPEKPGQELLVAIAGPIMSLVIAAALFGIVAALGAPIGFHRLEVVGGPLLTKLMWINVGLALFNLLPAFPMDGGRVLRALLSMRMDRTRATALAARIGQAMALLLGVLGLFFNPMLAFIAVFVWLGARGEASMVELKSSLRGLPVRQAMITDFQVLAPGDPLSRAVDLTLSGFQRDFPVVEGESVAGVLTHTDLLRGLSQYGPRSSVEQVMQRRFETAEPTEMLEVALERLQACDCHALIVRASGGQVVGLVTPENVGEMLTMERATRA